MFVEIRNRLAGVSFFFGVNAGESDFEMQPPDEAKMEADTNLRTIGCRVEKLIPDAHEGRRRPGDGRYHPIPYRRGSRH